MIKEVGMVSDCDYVQIRLDDYIDGTLPALEDRKVRAHLLACSKCSKEVEQLFFLEENIEKLMVKAPDSLVSQIQEEAAKEGKWRKRRFQRIIKWSAAAILIFGIIYYYPRAIPSENIGDTVAIHSRGKKVIVDGDSLSGDLTVVGGDVYVQGEIKGNITSIDGQVSAMVENKSLWERFVGFWDTIYQRITGGDLL